MESRVLVKKRKIVEIIVAAAGNGNEFVGGFEHGGQPGGIAVGDGPIGTAVQNDHGGDYFSEVLISGYFIVNHPFDGVDGEIITGEMRHGIIGVSSTSCLQVLREANQAAMPLPKLLP